MRFRSRSFVAAALSACLALLVAAAVFPTRAHDWPHFLGPAQDLHSFERGLNLEYSTEGPPLLWEVERGRGHAGPVIADGKLVFIHRVEREEEIRCLDAETGEALWSHRYPVEVSQSYGIVDAPRSSPTIDPATGLVYTLGNQGDLLCLALEDGSMRWSLKLEDRFGSSPSFFGYGSAPLVYDDKLIVHAGGEDACVVALEKTTGEVVWRAVHEWNGGYSSPVIAKINEVDRLLVYASGMVRPPHGGLLCIDPITGTVESAFPWRSDNFASVTAATPVPCGSNRVFLTEDYGLGGVMLEYDAAFQPRRTWSMQEFGCQLQTPIYREGTLYGFGGNGGLMMAVDAATGRLYWHEHFYQTTIPWEGREIPISLGRASIVHVDGAFLILTEDGALLRMALGPGGYEILSSARLFHAPEAWAPPAISKGRLYVVQNEMGSRLLCYDLRFRDSGEISGEGESASAGRETEAQAPPAIR